MGKYALAIDLGASSGRLIVGKIKSNKIELNEVYRFKNQTIKKNGHECWDIDAIFENIKIGFQKCNDKQIRPSTVGIDTWGVDYALVDSSGELSVDYISYRDHRTDAMPDVLEKLIPYEHLYSCTGIAKQSYNTVYQLMAQKQENSSNLNNSKLLFTPSYLSYLLTGKMANEYSMASTSGLLDTKTKQWNTHLLDIISVPKSLLDVPLVPSGSTLGALTSEMKKLLGCDCNVILPPSHDTASAFLTATQINKQSAILSSGTWSLLGTNMDKAILSPQALDAGFTNEIGYNNKYTFLRNIMGLWILQQIRKEWNDKYSFAQMAQMALQGADYEPAFDATAQRFLSPVSMQSEIVCALTQNNKTLPKNDAQLLYCVNHSLAIAYSTAIKQLEKLTNTNIQCLQIVGGGCQNITLNKLTAQCAKIDVIAGPSEATAIGNLISQWLNTGEIENLSIAGELIKNTDTIKTFKPTH